MARALWQSFLETQYVDIKVIEMSCKLNRSVVNCDDQVASRSRAPASAPSEAAAIASMQTEKIMTAA
jgi:hypothetical protein